MPSGLALGRARHRGVRGISVQWTGARTPQVPKTDFIAHNEVAGFVIAVVGAIYAVLLASLCAPT